MGSTKAGCTPCPPSCHLIIQEAVFSAGQRLAPLYPGISDHLSARSGQSCAPSRRCWSVLWTEPGSHVEPVIDLFFFFFVGAVKTLKLHAPFATPADVDCSGPWTEVTKSKPHSKIVTLQPVGNVRGIIRGAIIVLSPPRLVCRF